MSLKIPSFVVSVDWLLEHLENESLLILDATIPKVGSKKIEILEDTVKVTEELEISEFGSKVDDDGTPLDAVEIGVTSINLKDNKVSTSKIYTKAHKPNEIK